MPTMSDLSVLVAESRAVRVSARARARRVNVHKRAVRSVGKVAAAAASAAAAAAAAAAVM